MHKANVMSLCNSYNGRVGKQAIGETVVHFPMNGLTTPVPLSPRLEPQLLKIDPVHREMPQVLLSMEPHCKIYILQWLQWLTA